MEYGHLSEDREGVLTEHHVCRLPHQQGAHALGVTGEYRAASHRQAEPDSQSGAGLRDYVFNNMEKFNSDVIITYEKQKYWRATLSSEIITNIFINLKYHKANQLSDAFELPSKQYILDL